MAFGYPRSPFLDGTGSLILLRPAADKRGRIQALYFSSRCSRFLDVSGIDETFVSQDSQVYHDVCISDCSLPKKAGHVGCLPADPLDDHIDHKCYSVLAPLALTSCSFYVSARVEGAVDCLLSAHLVTQCDHYSSDSRKMANINEIVFLKRSRNFTRGQEIIWYHQNEMETILDKVREEAFNLEQEKKKYRTNSK